MNTFNTVSNTTEKKNLIRGVSIPSLRAAKAMTMAGVISLLSACSQADVTSALKNVGIAPKTDVEKKEILFNHAKINQESKGWQVEMVPAGNNAIYYKKMKDFKEVNGTTKIVDLCKQQLGRYADGKVTLTEEKDWNCVDKAQ